MVEGLCKHPLWAKTPVCIRQTPWVGLKTSAELTLLSFELFIYTPDSLLARRNTLFKQCCCCSIPCPTHRQLASTIELIETCCEQCLKNSGGSQGLGKIILIPTIVLSLIQNPVRLQVLYSCCASPPSAKKIKLSLVSDLAQVPRGACC